MTKQLIHTNIILNIIIIKNVTQYGILLTSVPRDRLCYTLTNQAYKNQDGILLTVFLETGYVIL